MEKMQLTQDGREAKRAYDREWQRAHREQRKVSTERKREANVRYWNRKGAELAAQREGGTQE